MWCLAIAATCGRWVILITCEEEDISFKSEPTSEATLPLIPESISSKIIVEILLNVDECGVANYFNYFYFKWKL